MAKLVLAVTICAIVTLFDVVLAVTQIADKAFLQDQAHIFIPQGTH
jgi:hypothetical protein